MSTPQPSVRALFARAEPELARLEAALAHIRRHDAELATADDLALAQAILSL